MIDLEDPRWENLSGGYRIPYDPRPSIRALDAGGDPETAWDELWRELHHQGDVGDASYASVVALVDLRKRKQVLGWRLYALASTIELARHRRGNPAIPEWLSAPYRSAWAELLGLALDDLRSARETLLIQAAMAVVALAKGEFKLGALLDHLDSSELDELLEERLGWSGLYGNAG
jgi:hypothetical protein